MRGFKRWYFWALVAFIVAWVVVQVFFPPARARVRQLMKYGAEAVEREDTDRIMKLLADDFVAETSIDRGTMQLMLDKIFRRYEKIRIKLEKMRVIIDGDEARVYFSAWAEGTLAPTMMEGMPLRKAGAVEEALAVWHKIDEGWKLSKLKYVGLEEGF